MKFRIGDKVEYIGTDVFKFPGGVKKYRYQVGKVIQYCRDFHGMKQYLILFSDGRDFIILETYLGLIEKGSLYEI